MNDTPRKKLVEIIARHGTDLIESPRRCENLLRDYCAGFRREISVLTMALEERVPLDLLAAKSTPRRVLLNRLVQRLCDNLALSEQAARWSVNSWAWALKVISDEELCLIERETIESAQASISSTKTLSVSSQKSSATSAIIGKNSGVIAAQSRRTLIVSSDGSGDYTNINQAIKNSPVGARILIRPGTYYESLIIDKNLEIIGDGQTKDVIVLATHSNCLKTQTEKALISGLTLHGRGAKNKNAFFSVDISGGELTLENCDITSDSLSCIAIHGSSSNPTISNCRIYDGSDSGVYFSDNARGQIENCDVFRNRNVGIAVTQGANPSIKNCRVYEGNSGGIVVWGNGASGTVEDCTIFAHRLANIGISEYANPTFRRCKVYRSSDVGVFVQQNGYGKLENCDIFDNEDAEVAISSAGNPILRGNKIHDGKSSGVVVRDKGRALIENCSIYNNARSGVEINGESVVAVRSCNINRNGKVALSVKEKSAASVENCDLRGNRFATWESEHGVIIERKNNRE